MDLASTLTEESPVSTVRTEGRERRLDNMSISRVVRNNLCTGCGTCVALCPSKSAQMVVDNGRGIYIPRIDLKSCSKCGVCVEVCPAYGVDPKKICPATSGGEPENVLLGRYSKCYVGHSLDPDIRANSSSGGMVTQILIFALENKIIDGALVTTYRAEDALRPLSFIARTRDQLCSATKSKYCPVPVNTALREILETPGRYAVVGLPCQIRGVRLAESINTKLQDRIILHLALRCNHMPTFLATEYLLRKLDVSKNEICKLDYRGNGYPGGMKIVLKGGHTKFVPHFSRLYWGSVFQSFFYPLFCALCEDRNGELSDIAFMDAWLPEYLQKSVGKSIVIARNRFGEQLLQRARQANAIELKDISVSRVIESQSLRLSARQYAARMSFFSHLGKEVPEHRTPLMRVGLLDYVRTVLFCIQMFVSGRRALWFLLDFYLAR